MWVRDTSTGRNFGHFEAGFESIISWLHRQLLVYRFIAILLEIVNPHNFWVLAPFS